MSFSVKELIQKRRSVRTFDGRELSKEDRSKLENYVNTGVSRSVTLQNMLLSPARKQDMQHISMVVKLLNC